MIHKSETWAATGLAPLLQSSRIVGGAANVDRGDPHLLFFMLDPRGDNGRR